MKFKKLNEASPSSIKKLEDLREVSLSDLYSWNERLDGIDDWNRKYYTPGSDAWWDCTHEYNDDFSDSWFTSFVYEYISKNFDETKNLIKGVEKLLTSKAMPVKIDKNIIEIYKENAEKYQEEEYYSCFWILDECAKYFLKYNELIDYYSFGEVTDDLLDNPYNIPFANKV